MARCNNCNKFVLLEDPYAEDINHCDIAIDDGFVEIAPKVVLYCSECGLEIKELTFEYEESHKCPICGEDHLDQLSLSRASVEGFEDFDFNGKKGNKLKNPIKYWGVDIYYTIACNKCKNSLNYEVSLKELPKNFDDC